MNAIIPLILSVLLTHCTAVQMSSPEPMVDPLPTRQELFITPAGAKPWPQTRLTPKTRNRICPDDFPTGFSIRCVVPFSTPKVYFRVNGRVFRTDRRKPYYIAGDRDGFVYPFRRDHSFSVGCKVGGYNVWTVVMLGC